MLGSALMTGAAVAAVATFTFWPFQTPAPVSGPASAPSISMPDLVRLTPAPFLHRLDGDWRRNGRASDAPIQQVSLGAAVDIMIRPVSTGDYLECVADGACLAPNAPLDRPDLPVVGVSWLDAMAYAGWLSARAGGVWRLPSDLEWAQGAGNLFRDDALGVEDDPTNPAVRLLAVYDAETARNRDRDREIRPVGRLNVNELGIYDIGGPVWEWTSTCLRRVDTDQDGMILHEHEICGVYIAEGLHRAAIADFVRDPKTGGCSVGVPPDNMGFRLVREVNMDG